MTAILHGQRRGKWATMAEQIRDWLANHPGERMTLGVSRSNVTAARRYLEEEFTPEERARIDVIGERR